MFSIKQGPPPSPIEYEISDDQAAVMEDGFKKIRDLCLLAGKDTIAKVLREHLDHLTRPPFSARRRDALAMVLYPVGRGFAEGTPVVPSWAKRRRKGGMTAEELFLAGFALASAKHDDVTERIEDWATQAAAAEEAFTAACKVAFDVFGQAPTK